MSSTSPPRVRVILVRHAQSENNEALTRLTLDDSRDGLVADPHLTATGHAQAARLGAHLAAVLDPDEAVVVRTSPMLRTIQTARPLLEARGITSQLWGDLHEHGGLYYREPALGTTLGPAGISLAQLRVHYPAFVAEESHSPSGWWGGRDAETEGQYDARVARVVEELRRRAAAAPRPWSLVLVTHGTFLTSLMQSLLGTTAGGAADFRHHNGAYSELVLTADAAEAVRVDVIEHLAPELVTPKAFNGTTEG